MKLANNVSGMVSDTLNSTGSLRLVDPTANWNVLEGITVFNFLTTTYFVASFFRYELRNKELRITATSSRNIGKTHLFWMASAIFCLCLLSVVCTQIFMIISKMSTSETATETCNLCRTLSNVANAIRNLIFVLTYAFMWYLQQLIYKRSAMKHLRTRPNVVFSYTTLALALSSFVAHHIVSSVNLSYSHSVQGCTYKSIPLSGSISDVIYIAAVSTCGLMGIGLFAYPFCKTMPNKNRPPGEGLAKTVIHKTLIRYNIILVVFVVMDAVLSVTTVWLVKNRLVYESLVMWDTSSMLQSVAVTMCLDKWRKIVMWWAV